MSIAENFVLFMMVDYGVYTVFLKKVIDLQ